MKAIVKVAGKQYIVTENQTVLVDKLDETTKKLNLEPLLIIDDQKTHVGTPVVAGAQVAAEVIEPEVKGDKIKVVHFKSKKRVHKVAGHRQKYTSLKIGKITLK